MNNELEADALRQTERRRLRALVAADIAAAAPLHADDFQLINPGGGAMSKDQYLGNIASGVLDYKLWEPDGGITVRLHGDAAAIRYRSRLEAWVRGESLGLLNYWHTDTYEKRDGQWQVVWSQATRINTP